jgi:DELLA protein
MGGLMDHEYFVISYQRKKRDHHVFCLSIHMTGPPDLNLVLTEMSSPLVNKLMACAKAVAVGNLKLADVLYEEMEGLTAEETSEVTKKVVSYFAEALARRVHGVYPRNPFPLLPSSIVNTQRSLRYFEFIPATIDYLAAAYFSGKQPVHFIDFSIMLGSREYDSLLRKFLPNRVFRLTNIGPNPCKDNNHIQERQRKLTELARQLNIDFQLKQLEASIPADIEECVLKLESTSEDEIVIVRWEFELHKLLAIEGAIERVLSKLKELKSKFMLINEQEADHNSPDFFDRFALSFQYYSRVFNHFNCVSGETEREEILERHWRRQISNVVACKGIDRVERHQTFDQWKERLRGAGFRPFQNASRLFKTICKFPMFYPFHGHPLFFASLWEPIDPTEFSRGK